VTLNKKDYDGKKIGEHVYMDVSDIAKAVATDKYDKYTFKDNLAYVMDLPSDMEQTTPEIPDHGAHFVKKADYPMGPMFGTYKDKMIFIEYHISQTQFKNFVDFGGSQVGYLDKSYGTTKEVPLPKAEHFDFFWAPGGHIDMKDPHLDIHMVFTDMKIK
jgi:hypothetical protein